MKILIVSDAWQPQINGVVRTLEATAFELERMGHDVLIIGPDASRRYSFPMPGYPEITLEFFAGARLQSALNDFQPDLIHLATEGPLGWSMRRLCRARRLPFTTSYHSRFPEYLAARISKKCVCEQSSRPARLNHPPLAGGSKSRSDFGAGSINPATRIIIHTAYAFLRRFHAPSASVMVATESMENELRRRGFKRLVRWHRGVDTNMFRPHGKDFPLFEGLPRPILLYVGRVAREKNLSAFLELKTEGSIVAIGDGPDLPNLQAQYPDALFMGSLEGAALARAYAAADLFVFPSMSETFGLVLLEASASGLRIAASPAPGPVDLFNNEAAKKFAALDWDLQKAVDKALALPDDPSVPRRFADGFSWQACTEEFFRYLQATTA